MWPGLFYEYEWHVSGGLFQNGEDEFTSYNSYDNDVEVTWSSTPQEDDAYLLCILRIVNNDWPDDISPHLYAVWTYPIN